MIKLLLADDSITIQKVVGIIFAGEDYQLAIVDNGDAALDKAREIRPDVLLVDVVMPGRTGYEVCEEVRRDPALKGTPILLLTGAFEPFDEGKARQCGADDFIAKPFESQHLIDKVVNLADLGKRRKATAPAQGPAVTPSPQVPPSAMEKPVQPPPAATFAPSLAAEAARLEAVPEAAPQFEIEVVEGTPDDDLWGAFDLEEVVEGEVAGFGEVSFEEEEAFATELVEEPFSFAEEPEPAVQPAELATKWTPVEEETFVFAEEPGGAVFETVAGEQPVVFEEEAGETFEIIPEEQFGVFAEEPLPVFEAASTDLAEFFAEEPRSAGAEPPPRAPSPSPAAPEIELRFAPEEEYMPVTEAVSAVGAPQTATPLSPAAEPSLSEEQLAQLVSRISRDIIEKIAWEVVPDLAERIITEEIRKIREGK